MNNQQNDRGLLSEINVTPLVDVMLVLLIIFMVTAPMLQQGIDVDLPNVVAKDIPVREEKLVLTITKKREIFINEHPVEILRLREKLYSQSLFILHLFSGSKFKEVFNPRHSNNF